jgi:hypothetical protein
MLNSAHAARVISGILTAPPVLTIESLRLPERERAEKLAAWISGMGVAAESEGRHVDAQALYAKAHRIAPFRGVTR